MKHYGQFQVWTLRLQTSHGTTEKRPHLLFSRRTLEDALAMIPTRPIPTWFGSYWIEYAGHGAHVLELQQLRRKWLAHLTVQQAKTTTRLVVHVPR